MFQWRPEMRWSQSTDLSDDGLVASRAAAFLHGGDPLLVHIGLKVNKNKTIPRRMLVVIPSFRMARHRNAGKYSQRQTKKIKRRVFQSVHMQIGHTEKRRNRKIQKKKQKQKNGRKVEITENVVASRSPRSRMGYLEVTEHRIQLILGGTGPLDLVRLGVGRIRRGKRRRRTHAHCDWLGYAVGSALFKLLIFFFCFVLFFFPNG